MRSQILTPEIQSQGKWLASIARIVYLNPRTAAVTDARSERRSTEVGPHAAGYGLARNQAGDLLLYHRHYRVMSKPAVLTAYDGALRCTGVLSVARNLRHSSPGHLAFFPPIVVILWRMAQILGSRFTSSPKGRRALAATLSAAPSDVVPIAQVQILGRKRMPIAVGSRYIPRGQLESLSNSTASLKKTTPFKWLQSTPPLPTDESAA